MYRLVFFIDRVFNKILYILQNVKISIEKKKLGYCGKNVSINGNINLCSNIFLYDNVNLQNGTKFIIGPNGKFIMKENSGASQGLTVITGKHGRKVGSWNKTLMESRELDVETTVLVCEDVRIGANVTLMPGVTVGRGSQIGACSVVTKDVPPYSICVGNPAHVIKFMFTPNEIIEHENKLYAEKDRLPFDYVKSYQEHCKLKETVV